MKIATTTADYANYGGSRSIAAPLHAFASTPFRHFDLSFYRIIYSGSPWISQGDLWKQEVEECQSIAEKCGYDFCQAHAPDGEHFTDCEARRNLMLATKRSIEACGMLGIPNIVIHSGICGDGKAVFDEKNIEFFRCFEQEAEHFNVDLLIENSAEKWNPYYFLRTGAEMREFIEKAGIPRLHANWDTGHGHVQGTDQYSDVLALGSELRSLHIHDNFGDNDIHVMPMIGTINFDDLFRGLLEIKYGGCFTLEAGDTIRRTSWPYQKTVKEGDLLSDPPLFLMQKQTELMYDVALWMLESYGIRAE